jgi:hypothetical protein
MCRRLQLTAALSARSAAVSPAAPPPPGLKAAPSATCTSRSRTVRRSLWFSAFSSTAALLRSCSCCVSSTMRSRSSLLSPARAVVKFAAAASSRHAPWRVRESHPPLAVSRNTCCGLISAAPSVDRCGAGGVVARHLCSPRRRGGGANSRTALGGDGSTQDLLCAPTIVGTRCRPRLPFSC